VSEHGDLRAPFPWFGGKSRVAHVVWERFGDVPNYVEPFAGSLAVLLTRPHAPRIETVNDADCYLANFWRALQAAPDEVARWADWPVNEVDLHARHRWLLDRADFRRRMVDDPDYHDAKVAGWWVWGICQWIGAGWCDARFYAGGEWRQLPHLGDAGMGVHRPSQQLPHLGNAGMGDDLRAYMAALSDRLRRVRVCCGDWSRVVTPAVTFNRGVTGVLLDPPYSHDEREPTIYGVETDVADAVRAWAVANGDNPLLRIALCGYEGEHEMPDSWAKVAWKANGGYGSGLGGRADDNAHRERIWFSPHCLDPARRQPTLWEAVS
jgi:DNA adenine methylase